MKHKNYEGGAHVANLLSFKYRTGQISEILAEREIVTEPVFRISAELRRSTRGKIVPIPGLESGTIFWEKLWMVFAYNKKFSGYNIDNILPQFHSPVLQNRSPKKCGNIL